MNYFEMSLDEAMANARLAAEQHLLPQTVFRTINKNQWCYAHPLCRLHERIEQRVTVLPLEYFSLRSTAQLA